MFPTVRQRPVYALMLGAFMGVVASSCGVLLLSEQSPIVADSPWDPDAEWDSNTLDAHRRRVFLGWLWKAALFCAPIGAVIGGAVWVTLPPRPVWPTLLISAWWLLGAISGLLLGIGFLMLPFMAPHLHPGRDGSGGPGVGLLILLVGMLGILAGSIAGVSMGFLKARSRGRRGIGLGKNGGREDADPGGV